MRLNPCVGAVVLVVVTWPVSAAAEKFDVGVPKSCVTHADCYDSQYGDFCDPQTMQCGWCAADSDDCAPDGVCMLGKCVVSCTDAIDCIADQPICDAETGQCVACSSNADCSEDAYCVKTWCVPDECAAGETECRGFGIALCASDGSGWEIEACGDGRICEEAADGPACVDAPEPMTSVGSGSSTGDASTGSGQTTGGTSTSTGAGTDVADRGCACASGCDPTSRWLALLLLVVARRRRGSAIVALLPPRP